jgi:hypothetical protein
VAGAGGSLLDPGNNITTYYTWDLGILSNNIVQDYALYEGLSIAKERNIAKLALFEDSMIFVSNN